jgi:hypothetical protein
VASNPNDCSICGCQHADGVKRGPLRPTGWGITECPRCGKYEILGLQAELNIQALPRELRSALSCASRQASEAGQPLQISDSNAADLAARHSKTRVVDIMDQLLRLIAIRSKRLGATTHFHQENDFTLIDCYSSLEFARFLQGAQGGGFIESYEFIGDHYKSLSLTMKGWDRVQPLPRPGGIPGSVLSLCGSPMKLGLRTRAASSRQF